MLAVAKALKLVDWWVAVKADQWAAQMARQMAVHWAWKMAVVTVLEMVVQMDLWLAGMMAKSWVVKTVEWKDM
jgi:hypothetical protein